MEQAEQQDIESDQKPRKRRILPPQRVLPLLFTLGNLVSGFAAIHYAYKGADWQGPWGWAD